MQNKYFKTVFRHVIIWSIAFMLLRFIRKFGREVNPETFWLNSFAPLKSFVLLLIIGSISGILFGTYEHLFHKYFTKKTSFGLTVFWGTLGYLILIVSFLIIIFATVNLFFNMQLSNLELKEYLTKGGGFVATVYCLLVGFIIEFIKQVDKKFGPGNLCKMILGKFYEPKEEERIFMFLDMRSSTTIAEKLGHKKFCRLVQDCFKDIDVIIPFKAEVYQYVGDEVVLTWEKEKGLEKNNCIHAFFAYVNKLKERQSHYENTHGLLPEFKAGMNIGKVMVAEVGEIKREISYYGDTLNTAARIQAKCNEYGYDFLLSGKLMASLLPEPNLNFEKIGQLQLRGKLEGVEVFGIERIKGVSKK